MGQRNGTNAISSVELLVSIVVTKPKQTTKSVRFVHFDGIVVKHISKITHKHTVARFIHVNGSNRGGERTCVGASKKVAKHIVYIFGLLFILHGWYNSLPKITHMLMMLFTKMNPMHFKCSNRNMTNLDKLTKTARISTLFSQYFNCFVWLILCAAVRSALCLREISILLPKHDIVSNIVPKRIKSTENIVCISVNRWAGCRFVRTLMDTHEQFYFQQHDHYFHQ